MHFTIKEAIQILERTPGVLKEMCVGLSENWTHTNEGGDSWSVYDVIGHLIHGEKTDWIPRARIILEKGVERPFESFDRFAQFEASKGKTLQELLNDFASKREARKYGIELIPRRFPAFNIFKHKLVPKHEILPPEKAKDLLEKHHIRPYQLLFQRCHSRSKEHRGSAIAMRIA